MRHMQCKDNQFFCLLHHLRAACTAASSPNFPFLNRSRASLAGLAMLDESAATLAETFAAISCATSRSVSTSGHSSNIVKIVTLTTARGGVGAAKNVLSSQNQNIPLRTDLLDDGLYICGIVFRQACHDFGNGYVVIL